MAYVGAFVLLGFGLGVIIPMFWNGMHHIDYSVEERQKAEYRQAVVLENFLSVKSPEIESYSFDDRRAVLPVEYFTQEESSQIDGIGYVKGSDDQHCHINKVDGLSEGGNYGIYIENYLGISTDRELHCTIDDVREDSDSVPSSDRTTSGMALLIREAEDNPPLPVKVFVYEIE